MGKQNCIDQQNFTRQDEQYAFQRLKNVLGLPDWASFRHFHFQLNKIVPLLVFFFKDLYILNISFFFCQIYEHLKLKPFHSHGAGLCHKFQLDFDFYKVNFYWFMCCQMCDLIS